MTASINDNLKKPKKRRRYGSFAWIDKKTGYLYARVRVMKEDGSVKSIYIRATNLTHAEQLADEVKDEHEVRGQAFTDGRTMKFKALGGMVQKGIHAPPPGLCRWAEG